MSPNSNAPPSLRRNAREYEESQATAGKAQRSVDRFVGAHSTFNRMGGVWYRRIMLHETDDSQLASRLGKYEFVEVLRAVLNYDGPLAIDNEE